MPPSTAPLRTLPSVDYVGQLRSLPLFSSLPEATLIDLAQELTQIALPAGTRLFTQGDDADGLYVVMHGRLEIIVGDRVVDHAGRGELVGEMALLSGEPRSATVRATRDSVLIRLSKAAFDRLVAQDAAAIMSVARLLVERTRRTTNRTAGPLRPAVVGIVALGRGLPIRALSRHLMTPLEPLGRITSVGEHEVRAFLGAPSTTLLGSREEEKLTVWLSEQEERSDILLLESDESSSPEWRARCVRQADTLLMVVDGDRPPPLGTIEELSQLQRTGARRELVLLHSAPQRQPVETEQWLTGLAPAAHHHVHLDTPQHIERLARFISGTSVTLVLGGGGARGFAHIGVYRALVEAGVPVDVVGGTSMGAVIAGQIALGWDSRTILEQTRGIFTSGRIYDPTLSAVSLFSGRRMEAKFRDHLGETRIEDLWTRFFCISSNLTTAEPVVHERGPLWKWIKSSGSIPGMAPPVHLGGDLLTDGGLLENLPVEAGRQIGRGRVIAVNVIPSVDRKSFSAYDEKLSPVQLFWRRFRPWGRDRRIPSLLDIVSRATSLASAREIEQVRQNVDLFFEPPVTHHGTLDVKAIDAIVEAGYRDACEKLSGDALPRATAEGQ